MREADAIRELTQTRRVQACAYAALVIAALAVTFDAPTLLMGFTELDQVAYAACFIAVIWISGFLIPSPWRLSLTVVIATLVWTSALQLVIQANDNDVKEATAALTPFASKAGPLFILTPYLAAATLLLVPMLLRRAYPAPDWLNLARALLISWAGMLASVAVLSFAGLSRFFDPFKVLLTPYIFPLMASALAVLLWSFARKQMQFGRPPVG